MSVTGHTVQNADTKLYADIFGNSFTPGTNIIIFGLNQTGGTKNQDVADMTLEYQWRFISVDSDRNLYKIQSVLTGGYAVVDSAVANQAIKTGLTSTAWEITAVDTSSQNFIIKLPNTNLVWSVPSGSAARTNIALSAQASGNKAMNQQWKLTNV